MLIRSFSLLLLLFWTTNPSSSAVSEEVKTADYIGWIPVQTVPAGKTTEIDLSRFVGLGPGAKLELVRSKTTEKTKIELDTAQSVLRITPEHGAQGMEDLVLRIHPSQGEAREGIFTYSILPVPEARFFYVGSGGEKTVSVAGSFNQWSATANPMKKIGANRWELSMGLPPGSHSYKLVVDGQWRLDPSNKQKSADGGRNENSILQISGRAESSPVLFARSREPEALIFDSFPENWKPLQISAIAQLPEGTSRQLTLEARSEGGWRVKTPGLPPESWVRIMGIGADGNPAFPARVRADNDPPWGTDRHDHIIYFAFIDRLFDGNPANNPKPDPRVESPAQYLGGDLEGVRKLLEDGYFEKLGINTLWLSPVNQNPLQPYQEYKEPRRWYTGYHGYWPTSSSEVETRFGGNGALTALTETAQKKKVSILLDLVLAHVHKEHPAFSEHPDWFGSLLLPDGTKNLRKWDHATQFTTWFEPFLPRFNYDIPPASAFLIENAADWVKRFHLDGFRLDAVKHIPPKFWTSFRQGLRQRLPLDAQPSFYLVGETFMDRPGINSFIGPNRLDGQFEFPLYDSLLDVFGTGKVDFSDLEKSAADSDRIFGPETVMSPLLGNHDKSRFLAYADGDLTNTPEEDEFSIGWNHPPKVDKPSSYEKLKMAFTFVLTSPGAPTIYYGDEVGMTGAQDPDNRRMFPELAKLTPAEKSVQDHVAKLNNLRARHLSIRYGSRRALKADREGYAVSRAYLNDRVLILYNRSAKQTKFDLKVGPEIPDGPLKDELGVIKNANVKNGSLTVSLPPISTSYLTP